MKMFIICFALFFSLGFLLSAESEFSGEDLFNEGLSLYQQRKYPDAVKAFNNVIDMNEGYFPQASYYLGLCYEKLGEFHLAVKVWENSLQKPESVIHNELQDPKMFEELTRIRIKKRIEDRDSSRKFFAMGKKFLGNGKFYQAQRCFQKAVKLDPVFWESWLQLGKVFLDLNNPDFAVDSFEKVRLIHPQSRENFFFYAQALKSTNKFPKASEILQEATQFFPDDKELRKLLNECSQKLKKVVELKYQVIKREGNEVVLNCGFNTGILQGEEYKTRFITFRAGESLKDMKTGENYGETEQQITGEILLTIVKERVSYGIISVNKDLKVGDWIRKKEKWENR